MEASGEEQTPQGAGREPATSLITASHFWNDEPTESRGYLYRGVLRHEPFLSFAVSDVRVLRFGLA